MILCREPKGKLRIGRDFADAVVGKCRATGTLEVARGVGASRTFQVIPWTSTVDCVESERALRSSVKREGLHVVVLTSQGVEA